MVNRQFGVQFYPHTTRTWTLEASGGIPIVLAKEDEVRRADGEECPPTDVMTNIIDYATLEKHFEKLALVNLGCMSDTHTLDFARACMQNHELQEQVGSIPRGLKPRGREQIVSLWHEK